MYTQTEAHQELKMMAEDANDVLIKVENVFPFVFFPDTITLDRVKLTIAKRKFFRIAEVESIQIEDILNVETNIGPLFGSVRVTCRVFTNEHKPIAINYLTRNDAARLKQVLQGYIIARSNNVDTAQVPTRDLVPMLVKLGQDAG